MELSIKFGARLRHKNGKTYMHVRETHPVGLSVSYAPDDYVPAIRLLPDGEFAPGARTLLKAKYLRPEDVGR